MLPLQAVLQFYVNTHKNGLFELDVAVVAPAACINGLPKCPKWFSVLGAPFPLNCGTACVVPMAGPYPLLLGWWKALVKPTPLGTLPFSRCEFTNPFWYGDVA